MTPCRLTSCNCTGAKRPARVKEIGELFARPTMKAIGVAARGDLAQAEPYEGVADILLIDAKPPKDAVLPGGNGRPFDWSLTRDFHVRPFPGFCPADSTPTASPPRLR